MHRRPLLAALLALPAAPALAQPTPFGSVPRYALLGPAQAQAGSPVAVVEGFHAALLGVMREAQRLGARGREARLRPAMEGAFDLPAMTRIAVGPPWTGFTPAQQAALVQAFSDWAIANYAGQFNGYGGETFQTLGEAALANGDRSVRTQLNRPNDAPVVLTYRLTAAGGGWRIVDVYYTGTISELASRRAEFTTLLRDGGPERLVAELRGRTATLLR